jgi:hypothetical protein
MNAKTAIVFVVGLVVLGLAILHRPSQTAPEQQPEEVVMSSGQGRKPRLPAPQMPVTATPAPEVQPSELEQTNAFARLLNNDGKPPELSRAQVEAYVAENRRSAESLLAAFRLTHDRALLQEAAEKYPNEPKVHYAGWFSAYRNENSSPEERRQWLRAFKQSAPENALANYLSAQDHFKSGETDQAVEELIAASGKPRFQSYEAEAVQNLEEAYLSAGYSAVESKAAAAYSDASFQSAPPYSELKRLAESLAELSKGYRLAGDEASSQAVLQMGLELGQRVEQSSGGSSFVTQNGTGVRIQRILFGSMDVNVPYGEAGQTVQDQLNALTQRGKSWSGLWKQAEPTLRAMSDQDLITYFDRMKTFGEVAALRWLVNRQSNQ